MSTDVVIRVGGPDDADRIAELHAASWQSAYRGVFSDAFLDGPVVDERRAMWRTRFGAGAEFHVLLAERDAAVIGFICFVPDADAVWGGLIDNFHMLPTAKGQGVGRRLFAGICHHARATRPDAGVYLFVLERNMAARRAYDALGGRVVEALTKHEPDGQEHAILRYAWSAGAVSAA